MFINGVRSLLTENRPRGKLCLIVGSGAVWLETGEDSTSEPRSGSDRVVCEVTQPRWDCGFPSLDYHWARPGRYRSSVLLVEWPRRLSQTASVPYRCRNYRLKVMLNLTTRVASWVLGELGVREDKQSLNSKPTHYPSKVSMTIWLRVGYL